MVPGTAAAAARLGASGAWANRGAWRQIPRMPTATAINLDACLMVPPAAGVARRGALPCDDGEVDVPGQRLVRELVGDLDLEPVVAVRKRCERHGLTGLQLMSLRHVELRRQ